MFDVHILPLSSQVKEEGQSVTADFLAAQSARTVARQRRKDQLFLHLSLQGSLALPADKRTLLLQRLSEVYYKTAGTTTGALRTVAESLNQFLLDRNSRLGGSGEQALGILTQIVQQDGRLTIAQSGGSHLFWISSRGVDHLYDPDLAGQGLGTSKIARVRFVQEQIQSGDSLLVCLQPPADWALASLASLYNQDIEFLRRKLAGKADIEAWMILFKPGAGKIVHLSVASAVQTPQTKPSPLPSEEIVSPSRAVQSEVAEGATPLPSPSSQPEEPPATAVSDGQVTSEISTPPTPESPLESPSPVIQTLSLQPHRERRSSVLEGVSEGLSAAGRALIKQIKRLLPDASVFQIPTSVMALIAILTPLLVVTLASVVYFRQGQVGEFERYLQLAEQAAQQAQSVQDPLAQRAAWQASLAYLDQALQYSNSSDAQALRAQAHAAIDQLESIKRLDFAVAMDDLPEEAQIIKIAVTENELFLLDANSGVVWRAAAAARGYVLNPTASCGPGIQGAAIGKLVGFGLTRKATQLQAVIVGLDASGRVVTCDYNTPPVVDSLTPDERGMGSLKGFLIDRGNSYVLDPEKNAIWVYWKNKYTEKPELFFSEDVPPMQEVIDFAVYGEDLYLLYTDGHLAQCTYNATTPTRCVDPQPYRDSRPGRENQPLQSETPFTRLFVSNPPEPALYLLEPGLPSIYQFSLRLLAFHAQYRNIPPPSFSPFPQGVPATALAISSEQRLAFLAFGNRLYYANLP